MKSICWKVCGSKNPGEKIGVDGMLAFVPPSQVIIFIHTYIYIYVCVCVCLCVYTHLIAVCTDVCSDTWSRGAFDHVEV